ncbi:MAG TPA: cellulose binding domain-containing protein, partial [Gammaproteobacteria bacterium]|nr:cellulose binding domain-containing protein [Gammaproteobacteria bacterium]
MNSFFKIGALLGGLMLGQQAFAAVTCSTISSPGSSFFQTDVNITNSGATALSGWTINVTFPEPVTVRVAFNTTNWAADTGTTFSFSNCCS